MYHLKAWLPSRQLYFLKNEDEKVLDEFQCRFIGLSRVAKPRSGLCFQQLFKDFFASFFFYFWALFFYNRRVNM